MEPEDERFSASKIGSPCSITDIRCNNFNLLPKRAEWMAIASNAVWDIRRLRCDQGISDSRPGSFTSPVICRGGSSGGEL